MNPALLSRFQDDKALREAVRAFFIWNIRELAADKAVKGHSTSGIQDAVEAVDNSFDKLQQLYGKIPASNIPNSR